MKIFLAIFANLMIMALVIIFGGPVWAAIGFGYIAYEVVINGNTK